MEFTLNIRKKLSRLKQKWKTFKGFVQCCLKKSRLRRAWQAPPPAGGREGAAEIPHSTLRHKCEFLLRAALPGHSDRSIASQFSIRINDVCSLWMDWNHPRNETRNKRPAGDAEKPVCTPGPVRRTRISATDQWCVLTMNGLKSSQKWNVK